MSRILVINPGATSTKIAVFEDGSAVLRETVNHSREKLAEFHQTYDQLAYRTELIRETLSEAGIALDSLQIIMSRGGIGRPMEGGIYEVSEAMLKDMREATYGDHASNLGCAIASSLADEIGVKACIMDPVSVDEMEEVARISGLKELTRLSQIHALNSRAMAREVARELDRPYEELNLITAHLGGGISIIPHKKGKMVDCNNPMEMGPFCPDRSGGLPVRSLVKLAFSGKYTKDELLKKMGKEGGLADHLGTKDLREAENMAKEGDEYADLVLDAMNYQIAKEIGAMATVLAGKVDAIVLTGGMANSQRLVEEVTRRTSFIAPVIIKAGEFEMEALAGGGMRVLTHEETPKAY